ncbi:MAG: IS110 family transposase [Brevinematia bacterium]
MEAKKWIGVDIHKKQLTVHIISEDGTEFKKQYSRTSEGIEEFLKMVDKDTVIGVESTTWTRDFAKRAREVAKDVVIFNTVDLKQMMDRLKKNDANDAERLALIVRRFEKKELSTCIIKDDKSAMVKGLLNIREHWVKRQTEAKNEIISLLDFWGVEIPEKLFSKKTRDLEWLKEKEIFPDLRESIESLFRLIEECESEIEKLDEKIQDNLKGHKGYNAIRTIKGIGKTTAAYIVTKVEDIKRFDDAKKLVKYFGLAPRLNASDDKVYMGRITKRTDGAILRVLIQAAWASVRFNNDMACFYHALRIRKGKQKAIVAVARKLVVFSYYVWSKIEA